MLAGYCGIIATMWPIQDEDAPVIVDQVYSDLFNNLKPDSTKAALTLHHAVLCLHQQQGDMAFLSWMPFVHMGVWGLIQAVINMLHNLASTIQSCQYILAWNLPCRFSGIWHRIVSLFHMKMKDISGGKQIWTHTYGWYGVEQARGIENTAHSDFYLHSVHNIIVNNVLHGVNFSRTICCYFNSQCIIIWHGLFEDFATGSR